MIGHGPGRWFAATLLAGLGIACTPATAPDGTTTVRSAVGSTVVVTVTDGAGVLQAGIDVYALKNNGTVYDAVTTNANGQATFTQMAANAYRFDVEEAGSDFYSGAIGSCVTPGCTTASITITRVDVTVVDTSGTPQVNQAVLWESTTGAAGGWVPTGANGHALIAVPAGSYRFTAEQNDFDFYSGALGHCTVPGCTAVTITTTIPVSVTVKDTSNVPVANIGVLWLTTQGDAGGYISTNANGVAVLSVPQASMRFKVYAGDVPFYSGPAGHCTVPGCTSASITMSAPVVVTVVDTGGTPLSGKPVTWQDSSQATGTTTNTNASGQVTIVPPLGAVRFTTTVDGTAFYSSATYNCSQPGCTRATILVSQQAVVTLVDGSGNPISGRAVTPTSTEGITSGNKTTNASGQATFRLPFAHWQFKAKCSGTNETFYSGDAGHCFIPGGCLTAKIKMPCGQCTTAANGTACDDQNPCTGSSTCQSHFCTGSNPMSCSASDQCHDAGACGAETGTCSNPTKANGTSCNDSSACTTGETCQSGTCTGGSAVTCSASDQCHNAGTCNPSTGVCSNPAKTDGTSCDDNDACTGSSSCQAGVCTGANPVTCTASDQCHSAGTCNPATGVCSNPAKADGTACNDGNACTQTDACASGACVGANPVTCTAQDQCHAVGTCNTSTGACTNPTVADGTACNDGNNCTGPDVCTAGACSGTPAAQCGLSAPPVDRTIATDFFSATAFLYTGSNPIQTGIAAGTIEFLRASVVRGRVTDAANIPLAGVTIRVHDHPEFGQTVTRADGMFDIAVNGGGLLTLEYSMPGRLSAHRHVSAPKRDFEWADDMVLLSLDPEMTVVASQAPATQIVQGSVMNDADGSRQATLLIPPSTGATMVMADGSQVPMSQISVRATEYTVGPSGAKAMPAPLPPTTGYTYAVEYSTDEAIAAGAVEVRFDRPVVHYVDNFIGFPTGGKVPSGFYDRKKAIWTGSDDGRVIKLVGVIAGLAELDVDGDDLADDAAALAALGIDDEERTQLASLYPAGKSLWRVPITHFTPWDFNWGIGPPEDALPPNQTKPSSEKQEQDPCAQSGSIIDCENQTLRELVPLAGAPFSLEYSTLRMPGFRPGQAISIPLSGPTVPASLARIDLEIRVAGQRIVTSFPATANQTTAFTWDGNDGYGRQLQGPQAAQVVVRYVYPAHYLQPGESRGQHDITWGALSGVPIEGDYGRKEAGADLTISQANTMTVGGWDATALAGLGGWDLSIRHSYSPTVKVLSPGSGDAVDLGQLGLVSRLAGTGTPGFSGDGGPSRDAQIGDSLPLPAPVSLAPDGSIYFVDVGNGRVRHVSTDGFIDTVAGGGNYGVNGNGQSFDGHLGPDARFRNLNGLVVAGDGTIYMSDENGIYKIGGDGIIHTVAGGGFFVRGFSGDGGPATAALVSIPYSLATAADGTLYFVDSENSRIRRITPDGMIDTIAGDGTFDPPLADGAAAIASPIGHVNVLQMDVAPDGTVYFFDSARWRIRSIGLDGTLRTIAGTNQQLNACLLTETPAMSTPIPATRIVKVGPNNEVYFDSFCNDFGGKGGMIRKVGTDGMLHNVAGSPFHPTVDSGLADLTVPGQWSLDPMGMAIESPDSLVFAGLNAGSGAVVIPALQTYASRSYAFLYRVSSGSAGASTGEIAIASGDGSEVYIFSGVGRHLRTIDAMSGAPKYVFSYSTNGQIASVTDADGLVTTIERDSSGNVTGIVAPNGQRTTLTIGADGYLAHATNPMGNSVDFTYGGGGLLATHVDLRGENHTFTYDALGHLTRDDGPGGTFWQATKTVGAGGAYTVDIQTAEGRHELHVVAKTPAGSSRTVTLASGISSVTNTNADGTLTATDGTGVVTTVKMSPDPRFGTAAPFVSSRSVRTPAGLTSSMVASRVRTADLAGTATQTDSITLNGRTTVVATSNAQQTRTMTTAGGRQAVASYDSHNRLIGIESNGFAPVSFSYDTRGRLTNVVQGVTGAQRITTVDYDPFDRPTQLTDAASNVVSLTYDAANNVTSTTLPDAWAIGYGVNAAGDLLSLTPPDRPLYGFQRTSAGLESIYTPPAAGSETTHMRFTYNLDRDLTDIQRLDNSHVQYQRDPAGRLSVISGPNSTTTFTYGPDGNVSGIAMSSGESLVLTHDGYLPIGESWSGPVAGSVTRTFNSDFVEASTKVNGASAIALAYDPDGLITGAGTLTLVRDSQNGLVTSATHGIVSETYGYNAFAEITGTAVVASGQTVISTAVTRDQLGRVASATEVVSGDSHTYGYGYDSRGRLTDVTRDGQAVASYAYDANSNRISATRNGQTTGATYDAQDRLLTSGSYEFDYNANGEQIVKRDTSSSAQTTYGYGDFGELRSATMSSGVAVDYIIDGKGRRVGKRRNGILVQGFLYDGPGAVLAELDGTGQVVARFVYGSRPNAPEYLIKGGVEYRIVTDLIGSPRVVVNSSDGSVVQRLDYDEFGRVMSDSNPGFQPFGFAGGIWDRDTGLVHFGAREYDPEQGRWTTVDPIRFGGQQTNMFVYANNDPKNSIDPTGLDPVHYALARIFLELFGDFSTSPNSAIFYSGEKNLKAALRLAKCAGKQTVFDTPGGYALNELVKLWTSEKYPWADEPFLNEQEVRSLWIDASVELAKGTSGSVDAFVDPAGGAGIDLSIWLDHEERVLKQRNVKINYRAPDYDPCKKDCR